MKIIGRLTALLLAGLFLAAPALASTRPTSGQICTVQCAGRQSISYADWVNCMQQCYQNGGQ